MPAPRRRFLQATDRVLTVLICAGLGLYAAFMTVFGRLFGMASDVCADSTIQCSDGPIVTGTMIAAYGPLLTAVLTIVLNIVLWNRWRWTSPLTLLGVAAAYRVVALAQSIIDAGIHRG